MAPQLGDAPAKGESTSSNSSTTSASSAGSSPAQAGGGEKGSGSEGPSPRTVAVINGKKLNVAMAGKDDGDIGPFKEGLAMLTLGLVMSWYYLVVIFSLLGVVGLCFAATRRAAGTALVLFWSTNLIPLNYKLWDAFCQSWIFSLWRAYFHYEWILEEMMDPKKKYLFAELPHGIFPWAEVISISVTKEMFPASKVGSIGATVIFQLPLLRHFFSWIGCRPASAQNIKAIFDDGCDCAVTVGGLAEMFLVGGEQEKVYLKKHKGFVREAIKNGADLVPVFAFGNSLLVSVAGEGNRTSMGLLRRLSRRIQASILIFYGRCYLPIPYRRPLLFVVGKPLAVEQKDNPTKEEIEAKHAEFCERVRELYYKFRPEWETRELLIV